MDTGIGASLELVDKSCGMSDMLNVDGDADAAIQAIVQKRLNEFRQLVPLLTNKGISLLMRCRG